MSGGETAGIFFITLTSFGGMAGLIGAWGWARAEKIRAEAMRPRASDTHQDAVLAELKAMKQQIAEMQSTGHQFDISFDAALTRLEERVARVETKTAIRPAPEEATQPVGMR